MFNITQKIPPLVRGAMSPNRTRPCCVAGDDAGGAGTGAACHGEAGWLLLLTYEVIAATGGASGFSRLSGPVTATGSFFGGKQH